MITVCDKTGIRFEADSKRQKNHPRISALLNEAAKDGVYNVALSALAVVKANGGGTIDEAIVFTRQRMSGEADAKWQVKIAEERRQKALAEARAERKYQNGILYANGYRWHKEDEESMDAFGATAFEERFGSHVSEVWLLTAPDGREVTVAQAMQEIRGQK